MPYAVLLAGCAAVAPEVPESSGDARLDALRQWAVVAPREDLVRVWNRWWSEFYFEYPHDEVLWRGVDRLAAWALDHPDAAGADLLTALHAAATQDPRRGSPLVARRADLQRLRAQKKTAPGCPLPEH